MLTGIFKISLDRLKQLLAAQNQEREIRFGMYSEERIHDWIHILNEASWNFEEELQFRIRENVGH